MGVPGPTYRRGRCEAPPRSPAGCKQEGRIRSLVVRGIDRSAAEGGSVPRRSRGRIRPACTRRTGLCDVCPIDRPGRLGVGGCPAGSAAGRPILPRGLVVPAAPGCRYGPGAARARPTISRAGRERGSQPPRSRPSRSALLADGAGELAGQVVAVVGTRVAAGVAAQPPTAAEAALGVRVVAGDLGVAVEAVTGRERIADGHDAHGLSSWCRACLDASALGRGPRDGASAGWPKEVGHRSGAAEGGSGAGLFGRALAAAWGGPHWGDQAGPPPAGPARDLRAARAVGPLTAAPVRVPAATRAAARPALGPAAWRAAASAWKPAARPYGSPGSPGPPPPRSARHRAPARRSGARCRARPAAAPRPAPPPRARPPGAEGRAGGRRAQPG